MDKIRKKYGDDNCVSSLVQACYPTGFTVMDFETLNAIGSDWIDKELLVKEVQTAQSESGTTDCKLLVIDDNEEIRNILVDIFHLNFFTSLNNS